MDCDIKQKNYDWIQLKYTDGKIYYWNRKTNTTKWEIPKNTSFQSYENYINEKKRNKCKINKTLNQKNKEIDKLMCMVKKSQKNLDDYKMDFKKQQKELLCGLYKMLYRNIELLDVKHIKYGIELRKKKNEIIVQKKKSSNAHSLSISLPLGKNKMYTICIDTSISNIDYHIFANDGKDNKKCCTEQVYKVEGYINKTRIKYYASYNNIIIMMDFKNSNFKDCISIYHISIYEIAGDNLKRFQLVNFDDIMYKDTISICSNSYKKKESQNKSDFIHPPIKSSELDCYYDKINHPCYNSDLKLDPNNPFTSPLFAMQKKKELIREQSLLLESTALIHAYKLGHPVTDLIAKFNELLPTNYEYNNFKIFLEDICDYNNLKDEIINIDSLKNFFTDLSQKIRTLKDITTEIYDNLGDLVIPTHNENLDNEIYAIFINWMAGYTAVVESSIGGQWNLSMPLKGSKDNNDENTYIEHIIELFIGKKYQIFRTFRKQLVDNSVEKIFSSVVNSESGDNLSFISITEEGVNNINSEFYKKMKEPDNINTIIKILLEGLNKLQENINYYVSLYNLSNMILDELNNIKKVINEEFAKHTGLIKDAFMIEHQTKKNEIELLDYYLKSGIV